MSESDLQREIMKAVTEAGGRVFRNNTGQAWVGTLADHTYRTQVTLINARPFHGGLCIGSSDLIGYYRGRFLAIEVKSAKSRVTDAQQNFIDQVNTAGGIGIVARSVDDVLAALR